MSTGDVTTTFTVTIPGISVLVIDANGTAGTAGGSPTVNSTTGLPTIRSTSTGAPGRAA